MNRLLTIILLSAAMCGMSTVCEAQEQVDVNIYDPYGEFPVHRTPMLLPTVYIDGFTLSFEDLKSRGRFSDHFFDKKELNDVAIFK